MIERLEPLLVKGRAGHDVQLQRWVHRQVSPTEWADVKRAPRDTASLMYRGWRKALATAGVGAVEPYALWHSSIVRQLREGVPTRLVASLHDTSVTMIERNYAFYITDALDKIARRARQSGSLSCCIQDRARAFRTLVASQRSPRGVARRAVAGRDASGGFGQFGRVYRLGPASRS
jgi:hypothetical protein